MDGPEELSIVRLQGNLCLDDCFQPSSSRKLLRGSRPPRAERRQLAVLDLVDPAGDGGNRRRRAMIELYQAPSAVPA